MEEEKNNPVLRTNRGLLKMLLFGILTLGIYNIVVYTRIANEMNLMGKDGKHTMHYCLIVFIFSWLTMGIVPLIWYHRLCNRMGGELARRGIAYDFNAGTFWLWDILGSLIVVGPFVFIHKFCKASNLLNADFNVNG